jgi:hypothetical protein
MKNGPSYIAHTNCKKKNKQKTQGDINKESRSPATP